VLALFISFLNMFLEFGYNSNFLGWFRYSYDYHLVVSSWRVHMYSVTGELYKEVVPTEIKRANQWLSIKLGIKYICCLLQYYNVPDVC